MRKLNYFKFDDQGKPALVGHFFLSDDMKEVWYQDAGSPDKIRGKDFIRLWNASYPIAEGVVSLEIPVEYFNNLIFRFSGRTWVEEVKE